MTTKKCYVCDEIKSIYEFYFDNKEKTRLMSKCKKCCNIRKGDKRKNIVILRIIETQKRRVRDVCKKKKFQKVLDFDKFFGIDSKGLKLYFENLFYGNISWDNYKDKIWEVDHKSPLLGAKTFDELIKLSHYTNLQPLLVDDHKIKSKEEINNLLNTVLSN